jgi:hypothetical protein
MKKCPHCGADLGTRAPPPPVKEYGDAWCRRQPGYIMFIGYGIGRKKFLALHKAGVRDLPSLRRFVGEGKGLPLVKVGGAAWKTLHNLANGGWEKRRAYFVPYITNLPD